MSLLRPADKAPGYLKAGFLGLAGSGKTFTAVQLAIGTRAHFNLPGPIAFFDTEKGSDYASGTVEAATGQPLLVVKSRSLDDLKATVRECVAAGVSVLIVDSVTHVWREVCDTYLAKLNEVRRSNRRPVSDKLEFQHWSAIKAPEMWGGWTDLLLNSPLHIIVCGRLGYEYEYEENAAGKKELVKTGVKMKAEGEFGYEPSLVIEMSAEQVMHNGEVVKIVHTALCLKDRTMDPALNIAGTECENPTFDYFAPHVRGLNPASHVPIDTSRTTDVRIDEDGSGEWAREKRAREILCEEIAGVLSLADMAGTSADATKKRTALLLEVFGTASKTAMENTRADVLREGLGKLRVRVGEMKEAKS